MTTRIRRRRTRDRIEQAPPALLRAAWRRDHDRLRQRMALVADGSPEALRESMRLRREAIADDEALAAEGLDWATRAAR